MQKTKNKTNKYVLLATYVVAVLCLIAGLFLPLFNGKEVLALKLGDVFKSLMKKDNNFSLPFDIAIFGSEKLVFDFMALVLVLYTVVTALAVFAFIPVALSLRKDGKLAKKFYYGVEVAAVLVISLYFLVVLYMYSMKVSVPDLMSYAPYYYVQSIGYNMVIAGCGTVIALLVLCGLDKKKRSTVKIGLFLLSLVGFLALFDFVVLLSKQTEFGNSISKVASGLLAGSGVDYSNLLYANKLSVALADFDVKHKVLSVLAALTATVVVVNLFIDTIKLATKKDKKVGRIFDIARFGCEVVLALCVLVTAFICRETIGLMLIVILVVAAVQLAIVIVRFIKAACRKSRKARNAETVDEEAVEDNYSAEDAEVLLANAEDALEETPAEEPVEAVAEEPVEESVAEESPAEEEAVEQPSDGEVTEEATEPTPPVPDEDGYVDPELDAQYQQLIGGKKEETQEELPSGYDDEDLEDVELYEPEKGTTYLVPVNEPDTETEQPAEADEAEPVEEVAEESEPVEEPVEEVAEEPAPVEEPVEEVKETDDGMEEPAQNPFREVKPYNPYEKHNNPFRGFEEPPQPYNPYRQQVQYEKIQPTRPAYEPRPQPKQYEQPVRPLRPRPIIQEFKPVPPVSEQPPKETRIYTIDTIYAGPIDAFISKLSNDERIEFAKTFIEKNKGNLGSIPDYVVGGDNRKFFSATFIYLGRIRGMVSDGLLNKMYKELNLF